MAALSDWLCAQVVPRRHKIVVPMAQRIARLEWSFILPPSLAVRKRAELPGSQSRSELARFYPAFYSAAQNNLKR